MKPKRRYYIEYHKDIKRYVVYLDISNSYGAVCTQSLISFKTEEEAKKFIKSREI